MYKRNRAEKLKIRPHGFQKPVNSMQGLQIIICAKKRTTLRPLSNRRSNKKFEEFKAFDFSSQN